MPARNRYRRYRKRRTRQGIIRYTLGGRKRANTAARKGVMSRSMFKCIGMPDRLRCTLRYNHDIGQFAALGKSNAVPNQLYYTFRANSVYDPEEALGGGYVIYNKQLGAFYEKFYVGAARVDATLVSWGTSTNNNIIKWCIYASTEPTLPAGFDIQDADGHTHSSNTHIIGPNVGNSVDNLSLMRSTDQLNSTKTYTDTDYEGQPLLDNPVKQWYFHIIAKASGTATPIGGENPLCSVNVNITYMVEYRNLTEVLDNA